MKKRFIFDENYIKKYAKKGRLKWLIIGLSILILIVIIIIVVLATRNNDNPITPAVPSYELKDELRIEASSLLPEVTDYFNKLENIDVNSINITYPDEFELSYDTSLCSTQEIEEIYSSDDPNFESYDCVQNYLITPATYGITILIEQEEYTVNLIVEDTTAPTLETKDLEIYEGDTYDINDFVSSCVDVTSECNLTYDPKNEIDYSNITKVGEHSIPLIATDNYGNETRKEATLTILETEGVLYTVTFDSDGGSAVRSRKINENGNVIEPDAPIKEGYIFAGWYLDDEKFDFKSPITENITLTAKWEEIPEEGEEAPNKPEGPTIIEISSISLNFQKIYLEIDQTKTVIARIYPSNATNKTVTWQTSNSNIATVSNGNITGVNPGTTTITATVGGKTASVEVVVTEASTSTCTYGNTVYSESAILSVDLTRNGCAINPNENPNENLSITDHTRLIKDLSDMGLSVNSDNFEWDIEQQKIKNTSGTGLVGYQITVTVGIIDKNNPYRVLEAKYILHSDGTRQFLINNICKNNICLNK